MGASYPAMSKLKSNLMVSQRGQLGLNKRKSPFPHDQSRIIKKWLQLNISTQFNSATLGK